MTSFIEFRIRLLGFVVAPEGGQPPAAPPPGYLGTDDMGVPLKW